MTPNDRKAIGAILFLLGLILHYAPIPVAGWQLALPVHLIAAGFFFGVLGRSAKLRVAG